MERPHLNPSLAIRSGEMRRAGHVNLDPRTGYNAAVWLGICTSSGVSSGAGGTLSSGHRAIGQQPIRAVVDVPLGTRSVRYGVGVFRLGGHTMQGGIRVRLPLLLVVALALAVMACSSVGGPAAGGSSGDGGAIVFGAPISLTGSLTKEGRLTRDGYEIWKDTYNAAGGITVGGKKYKIETKYYDDESDAQKTATLADKLIKEDKVNFLLGPYGTSATLQMSTVAEKNKIPMVEGNGAAESIFSQGYQYTFGVLSPAKNYLTGAIDMALAQNPKPATVAILSADDPFSVEVADAAKKYAEEKGLQVVYYQKYPDKSTDLRAPLTEAKGKNPDFFINSGHLQ